MKKRYYFDTSIWLDFLENRNEPNMLKGEWARKLIEKIISEELEIILSDNNIIEFEELGYTRYEVSDLLSCLSPLICYVESSQKQIGMANDLSKKRDVPKRDTLHALIARDSHATLVTLDNHFKKLSDIIKPDNPKDLI